MRYRRSIFALPVIVHFFAACGSVSRPLGPNEGCEEHQTGCPSGYFCDERNGFVCLPDHAATSPPAEPLDAGSRVGDAADAATDAASDASDARD
jgi:hypothetical protein